MPRRGPQVDEGNFTRIHNDLLSALAFGAFSSRELKVLLTVLRQTYGFQRKTAPLSLYDVVAATGLTPHAVQGAAKSLLSKNVLTLSGPLIGRAIVEMGLNKYTDTWVSATSKTTGIPHRFDNQNGDQNSHQSGHQIGDQIGEFLPQIHQNGHQNSHQIGDQNSDQIGEIGGPKPAGSAGLADPKEIKEIKKRKERNKASSLYMREGEPDTPVFPSDIRPGFGELVKVFLEVYERGGAILPHHKIRDLKDLCDALGLPAIEVAGHLREWAEGYRQRNRPVPRVATPTYFLPIIQDRLGHSQAPSVLARDPYAAYTGGT